MRYLGNIIVAFLILGFICPIVFWIISFGIGDKFIDTVVSYKKNIFNTLFISFFTAITSTFIAYVFSCYVWFRQNSFISKIVFFVMLGVLVTGLFARNYAWLGIFLNDFLIKILSFGLLERGDMLASTGSIILVMTHLFVPVAYFFLQTQFRSIHESWLSYATVCGANHREVLARIIVPNTYESTFTSFLFVFVSSVGYYLTPSLFGGGNMDMIGNAIWECTKIDNLSLMASMVSILLLMSILPITIILKINEFKSKP